MNTTLIRMKICISNILAVLLFVGCSSGKKMATLRPCFIQNEQYSTYNKKDIKKLKVQILDYRFSNAHVVNETFRSILQAHGRTAKKFFYKKGIDCFYARIYVDDSDSLYIDYSNNYSMLDTNRHFLSYGNNDILSTVSIDEINYVVRNSANEIIENKYLDIGSDRLSFYSYRLFFKGIPASGVYNKVSIKWKYYTKNIESQNPPPLMIEY